jgi:hypothetical protein
MLCEQAKFLFERAREGYAALGVLDMIEPLKFLERNILRLDRCEPLLSYQPLQAPAPSATGAHLSESAESQSRKPLCPSRKYRELSEAYFDDHAARAYEVEANEESGGGGVTLWGGGEEEEEASDTWQPMLANAPPGAHSRGGGLSSVGSVIRMLTYADVC